MSIQLQIVSSLEKIFPDSKPVSCTIPMTLLQGDRFSFQLCVRIAKTDVRRRCECRFSLDSSFPGTITARLVRPVYVQMPAFDASDGGYISDAPGLYPDRLEPLYEDNGFFVIPGETSALWIELETANDTPAGSYPIHLQVQCGEQTAMISTSAEVIAARLPLQRLKHTEWFHCDGIAQFYHEEVWSPRYWELLQEQIRTAAARGINMLLVPLWTPPLDTRIGHERLTTQLVDIRLDRGQYTFDFARLKRFLDLALGLGIRDFEMAHLFTQWGARNCPKIIALVDGVPQRIFGWDTEATGPAYRAFLTVFLPALTAALRSWGLAGHVYFHISDEPSAEALPQYRACRAMVEDLLQGFPIMDAMSDYSYFEQGICQVPVVATNHLDPFLTKKRPEEFWVYYCCAQGNKVSNRFIAMPSSRNRIIGLQFYKYKIQGFLQWGYNYYNNVTSIHPVDPFATADGDSSYPAGDPFMVYPGPDGLPQESLRLVVFSDALHDLRALELLESLTSRDHVLTLIEGGLEKPLTWTEYPLDPAFLLDLRTRVNREIASLLA